VEIRHSVAETCRQLKGLDITDCSSFVHICVQRVKNLNANATVQDSAARRVFRANKCTSISTVCAKVMIQLKLQAGRSESAKCSSMGL
jgi:hypothetical protein